MHCKERAMGKIDSVEFDGGVDGDFVGGDGLDVLVVRVVIVTTGGGGGLVADRVEGYNGAAAAAVVVIAENSVMLVPDVVVSGTFEEVRRP